MGELKPTLLPKHARAPSLEDTVYALPFRNHPTSPACLSCRNTRLSLVFLQTILPPAIDWFTISRPVWRVPTWDSWDVGCPGLMDRETAKATAEKRIRIGTTKVRTGCITCKIRRVKCDEEKPDCRRCKSTGRKCDGYQIQKNAHQSNTSTEGRLQFLDPVTSGASLIHRGTTKSDQEKTWRSLVPTYIYLQIPRDERESRSIDFFISRTGPQLAGLFDSKFWCDMVLRISQYDPAVRFCAQAVSSMHESFERKVVGVTPENTKHASFALQNYNKAIGCLSKAMSHGEASTEVVLTCCILFVCLEFLQGETTAAFSHIVNGHRILADSRLQQKSKTATSTLLKKQKSPGLEAILVPILSHLDVISVLFGQNPSGIDWSFDYDATNGNPSCHTPKSFPTLDDARLSILNILNLSLRLETSIIVAGGYVDIPSIEDHFKLERQLEEWYRAFTELQTINTTQSVQEKRASLLIQVHYHITRVLVKTNLASDEMIYDRSHDDFEAIVSLADGVAKLYPGKGPKDTMQQQPAFTFDIGTISPLYYTALKCRQPVLRRKALALVNAGPRRESIWDATVVSQVCKRVIELEEDGWTPQTNPDGILDADRRIDRVIIMGAPNFNKGSHIVCSFAKLDRTTNAWKSWEETFPDASESSPRLPPSYIETPAKISRLHDKACAAQFLTPVQAKQRSSIPERNRISGLEQGNPSEL